MSTTWAMPGGSGDAWAEDYERGRPGWPTEAVRVAGLPSTASVLDLGAGTGKLTGLLVREFERVVAVEPAEPMRRILLGHCPDVEASSGTGRAIPLANSSVDAVFAAQAFHWFDEAGALAEIARVLRPGGSLILMWNRPGGAWEPETGRAEAVLSRRMPGVVDHIPLDLGGPAASSDWQPAAADSRFEPFEATTFPTLRHSTATASSPSTPPWVGSQIYPTTSGCRCSTTHGRASPRPSTGVSGRHTSTGRTSATRSVDEPLAWTSVLACPPSGTDTCRRTSPQAAVRVP